MGHIHICDPCVSPCDDPKSQMVGECEFVRLQTHRETHRFFVASGVQLPKSISGQFNYHRTAFSSQVKSKIGNILTNGTVPRIVLNIDGEPVASKAKSHVRVIR